MTSVRPEKDRQFRPRRSSLLGMVTARANWEGRRVVRLLAVVMAAASAAAAVALPAAHAADMTVSGQVAPVLGVSLDGTSAGTVAADVTRVQRGDVTIVTVF